MIYLADDSKLILKSYSATTKGPRSTIRIEIETEDTYELGFLLRELRQVQDQQRSKGQAVKAAKGRRLLALPKPEGRP
ncbi:hypothetical protein [Cereibacter azotoformans]|uniref:Uncharacterized protein n=1 Tax=Cereibacter azotoformans TaxID=43057 RepID=A0A2T5JSG6_9RHOB|nr:hypothetical protein [Cereibacter azotoformans]MBO4168896.1 hypothetical protein [Cereibacter azotoformans]PTR11172.1 hypothetical protein C8J28_12833 [Cereibacter azotoformans]